MEGEIKKIIEGKGFGFIKSHDKHKRGDVFFHYNSFRGDVESLREGNFVTFEIREGRKGLEAYNVRFRDNSLRGSTPERHPSKDKGSTYFLPKDTSELLSTNDVEIENTALKIQKYIPNIHMKEKKFKITSEQSYTQNEINLLSKIIKTQYDILASYKYHHCVTTSLGARMMLGLGSASVFETGITLHHTYGFPYIPATTIKGCLRSYIIRDLFRNDEDSALSDGNFEKLFGSQKNAGMISFLDAYPFIVEKDRMKFKLELDIMNPHYPRYYRGESAPSDDQEPNPIKFYAIPKGTKFAFRLISNKLNIKQSAICGRVVPELLSEMLCDIGIGAKSTVGYGWFNIIKQQNGNIYECFSANRKIGDKSKYEQTLPALDEES